MTDATIHVPDGRLDSPAVRAIAAEPWAILPEGLETIVAIAARMNDPADLEAVLTRRGEQLEPKSRVRVRNGVAVVPVHGPIFRYANVFGRISAATSIDVLALDIRESMDSPNVRSIILDVDSPGGQVSGVAELAEHIRTWSASKPIVAYVSALAASAAYWLASAASEVIAARTASLGSVGVMSRLRIRDDSNEVVVVSEQSPRKLMDPQTDQGRADIQTHVDTMARLFIEDVAKYRGTSVDAVLSNFGQGGVLVGQDAVNAGMADSIGSLEATITRLQKPGASVAAPKTREVRTMSTTPRPVAAGDDFEQKVTRRWNSDSAIRREFGSFERFATYAKLERDAGGRIVGAEPLNL